MKTRQKAVEEKIEKRARAESLAERIKILFQFVYSLSADRDLLAETLESTSHNADMAMSMAPILGASGIDYEEAQFQNEYRAKRAEALLNLIDVLIETEKELNEFNASKGEKQKVRQDLQKILGL